MARTDDHKDGSPPIRVLVANISGVVLQLVAQALAAQPDMKLVGQVEGKVEVLMAASVGVDVLILGTPQVYPMPNLCTHLLNEFPDLKIVALAHTGETAMLYWLGVRRRRIGMLSRRRLLQQIRKVSRLTPTA